MAEFLAEEFLIKNETTLFKPRIKMACQRGRSSTKLNKWNAFTNTDIPKNK